MAAKSILTSHTLDWLHGKGLCSTPSLETLKVQGYHHLTTIQLLAFPELIAKKDVYLHARTGSGKTLAFLLPMLERLKAMGFKKEHGVGALIVSPARELALQILNVLQPLAEVHGFSTASLIGGKKLKKSEIENVCTVIVGTPGRLKELFTVPGYTHNVKKIKVLILDEGDELLNNGNHLMCLQNICARIPLDQVQKILVSATISEVTSKQAKKLLNTDLLYISAEKKMSASEELEKGSSTAQIQQHYLLVNTGDRLGMLITQLTTLREKKVIVFFSSCISAKYHHAVLSQLQLPVMYCMGKGTQAHRSRTYKDFLDVSQGTLLTTGMAERGWDIPGIHWVIQYDPPHQPQEYIHRVGRTGRGEGGTGKALIFLRPEEIKFIDHLKTLKVEMKQLEFEGNLTGEKDKVMSLVADNKSLQELGKGAYKTYLRAYQCHKFKKIFSMKTLDFEEVAQSFGFPHPPMHFTNK